MAEQPSTQVPSQPSGSQAPPTTQQMPSHITLMMHLWKDTENNFRDLFVRFLDEFGRDDSELSSPFYHSLALKQTRQGHTTIEVDLQHLREWDMMNPSISGITHFMMRNALHLIEEQHLHEVATKLLSKVILNLPEDEQQEWTDYFQENIKHFNIQLVDWRKEPYTLRGLYCDKASQLVTITGTVTRTSEVRPELRSSYFKCEICESNVGPIFQEFKFTEPTSCTKPDCKNRRSWTRIDERSVYDDWQKIRLQENANEIPAGCLPRSLDIVMRGHLTNQCKAGDRLHVSGCLAVVPDVASVMAKGDVPKLILRDQATANRQEMDADSNVRGLRGLGVRDLACKTTFIVSGIKVMNDAERNDKEEWNDDQDGEAHVMRGIDSDLFKELGAQWRRHFKEVASSPNCMDILVKYFLPSVYGNWHIKKGILLMLAGGVEKSGEKDGMKLRGDLNINIVGDPGTAKSAILRAVNKFVARSVYASGKMATAAGLTASVQRDREQNGTPVIEAGALMLADGGVCCIDEFDKMDPKDMSAIHEAMEQQTISIAKAGVQATLNARASVIAACNPIYGRYDPSRSFRQNVNLTAPILSRFDLMFVIMDDTDIDELVASHLLGLDPDLLETGEHLDQIRMNEHKLKIYLKIARTLKPKLTSAALDHLTKSYVVLRQQDVLPGAQRHTRMTVRQLESLVRLSEATAKLHLSDEVHLHHVDIAFDLFQSSLTKISKGTIDFSADDNDEEATVNGPRITSVDESLYRSCAHSIVQHFLSLQRERTMQNDFVNVEIPEDELTDWLILHQFPETDDVELVRNYEIAGKIIRQLLEHDQTLVASTMIDADESENRFISLHPAVTDETEDYLNPDRDERASRARRQARGNYVPADEVEMVDGGVDEDTLIEEGRFDAYLDQMNND